MVGALSSVTEDGPPERMMPLGFMARSSSAVMEGATRTENTPASRTRRQMSWAVWEPKSRTGTTSCSMCDFGDVDMIRSRRVIRVLWELTRCGMQRMGLCVR